MSYGTNTPRCRHPDTSQGLTGTGCPHEQRYHGVRPKSDDEEDEERSVPFVPHDTDEKEAYCRACDATLAPEVDAECRECDSRNFAYSGSCFAIAVAREKARA